MPIPRQELNVRDPGLGLSPESDERFFFLGTSSLGTNYVRVELSDPAAAQDEFGEGPLVEDLCYALAIAGGPVSAMKIDGVVAGVAGSVTKTPAGGGSTGTITVANAPFDAYEVQATITKSGANGVAEFQYSLDDGTTLSAVITVPSGGVFNIPRTNLELTFVPGAGPVIHEAGDLHEFDCTAPYYGTTEVALAITAILATTGEFSALVFVGEPASTSDGATLFAALTVHGVSLSNVFRYAGIIMDAGSSDSTANAITDFASQADADSRVMVAYGFHDIASSKPFAGWGTPRRSIIMGVGTRAADVLISTDLGRFPDGPVPGVTAISHDEFKNEVLDQHRFTTMRTWQGRPGFYITHGRMMNDPGSDFRFWQHRRVMDVALDTVHKSQQQFINTGVRVNSDGTIDERDAVRIEETVTRALTTALLDPNNAEGFAGHVSRLQYSIDRTNDVLATNTIKSKTAITPLAYVKTIIAELGFARI